MMKEHADHRPDEQLKAEIAELKAHPKKLHEEADARAFSVPFPCPSVCPVDSI